MASWIRGKCIGKGAFGFVNLAVTKNGGRVFAVKSVDRKTALPFQLEALENEIRILRHVSSPHVVAYLGDDVTCDGSAASSLRNLHLEYMPGGTVADLDRADVDERLVKRFAWCLVSALRDVHAQGVVHCDVKGRNVLVSGDRSVVKLADFGGAVEFSGKESASPRGSPMWMAPEVVRREYQGPESDVWSLGCTVIEMFTGKSPWEDRGVDTLSRIAYSNELPEIPSALSELGRDFLDKCLRREWSERWSCDQLLQHPFLLPCKIPESESSPRSVFYWVDSEFPESDNDAEEEVQNSVTTKANSVNSDGASVKNRICKLATESRVKWETQDWLEVRAIGSDAEPTTKTESEACDSGVNSVTVEQERVNWEIRSVMEVGTSLEYSENERVNRETLKFCGNRSLVWRWECDEWKKSNTNTAGVGCQYGLGEFDRISGIFSIYSFCCKNLMPCYLLLIYFNKLCFSIIYVLVCILLHVTERERLKIMLGRKMRKIKWKGD